MSHFHNALRRSVTPESHSALPITIPSKGWLSFHFKTPSFHTTSTSSPQIFWQSSFRHPVYMTVPNKLFDHDVECDVIFDSPDPTHYTVTDPISSRNPSLLLLMYPLSISSSADLHVYKFKSSILRTEELRSVWNMLNLNQTLGWLLTLKDKAMDKESIGSMEQSYWKIGVVLVD